MAYFQNKNGAVYLYRHDPVSGKNSPLPRSETKHLDGQPEHNLEAWKANWERAHEGKRSEPTVLVDADLIRYMTSYVAYVKGRERSKPTLAWHKQMLNDHVLPFFANHEPKLLDPHLWPQKSVKMLAHLKEKDCSNATILRCNTVLRAFWKWLAEEGHTVDRESPLLLRNPNVKKNKTPLKFTATPENILAWLASTSERDIRFMALAGYFFSLRPQETFALRPRDFIAGSKAQAMDCGDAMKRMKLYDRLAVNIHRQRVQDGSFAEPKVHSSGHVSCFDEKAAGLLVDLLKGLDKDTPLIHQLPDWSGKRWLRLGYPDLKLKDLRRASIYWLGHKTEFSGNPILLQKHARHSDLDTTGLYLRRPGESETEWEELDLNG